MLGACSATPRVHSAAASAQSISVEPFRADRRNLLKVTVCTRPFRPAGPRLEMERFGDKSVIHNYGHGGSGWSLSWGCAAEATALTRSQELNVQGEREFAVLGAGVIGLTTALTLLETGAKVTLYAEHFPSESRSARATGVWSPSSRIALGDEAPDGFAQRWEGWARQSHARHVAMIGLADDPIEFIPQYILRGGKMDYSPASRDFLHLDPMLTGLNPAWRDADPLRDPFPGKARRTGPVMTFNVARYFERLTRLFQLKGGQMVRRSFADRQEALSLPQPVIVNCMGYGAKAIWDADELVAVRGQINWLLPQPNARYAMLYDGVSVVSRRDGIVVQYVGPNEDWGYGDESETPMREETDRALATVRRAYE